MQVTVQIQKNKKKKEQKKDNLDLWDKQKCIKWITTLDNKKYNKYGKIFKRFECDGEFLIKMYNREQENGYAIPTQLQEMGVQKDKHKLSIAKAIRQLVENYKKKHGSVTV